MARLMVDTSVFVDIERRGELPDSLASREPDSVLAISAITVSELLAGLYRAESEERRQQRRAFVDRLKDTIEVFPFDGKVAEVYALISDQLRRTGERLGVHDLMIGTTALTHGFAILTRDSRSFPRVPGLQVQELR